MDFYEKVRSELDSVLDTINDEKKQYLSLKKPIDKNYSAYYNRIFSSISMSCVNYRETMEDNRALNYYSNKANALKEYKEIMALNFFINCEKGIDYIFNKKLICMLMGISVDAFQDILTSGYEGSKVFKNIEEWLIAIRQDASENFQRNAIAVDKTLKTKGEYGGFEVEEKIQKAEITQNVFNITEATPEEIKKHLAENYKLNMRK